MNNHEWLTLPGEFKASIDRFTKSHCEQIASLSAAHPETADLKEAILKGAKGFTQKQLERQAGSLEDVFMPNGLHVNFAEEFTFPAIGWIEARGPGLTYASAPICLPLFVADGDRLLDGRTCQPCFQGHCRRSGEKHLFLLEINAGFIEDSSPPA